MDTFKISKTIDAPLRYVFNWCTDFQESDPAIHGSSSQRKILFKSKSKAVYASLYKGEDGNQKIGVNIVTLKAPNYWHLDFYGEEDEEAGEYKLKSLGKNRTKLEMTFREKYKIPNPPTKASQVEGTNKIWDKYVSALEADYGKSK